MPTATTTHDQCSSPPPHARNARNEPLPNPSQRLTFAEFSENINDFFGVAQPSPAVVVDRSSPLDDPTRISIASTLPPPYIHSDLPPAYGIIQEPPTLSKYLFYYGFLFPGFWIVGAMILFMSLRPIPESECGKTPEEQAEELAIIRRTEVRWSQHCALALFVLAIAITITATTLALINR